MDIWDIVRVVVRRWAVSVPLVLAMIGAMAFVAVKMEPDYTATGNLKLLPPSLVRAAETGKDKHENPWDGDSLTDAEIVGLRGKAVHDRVEDAGYDGEWQVDVDVSRTSVITVTTTAHTPEAAQRTTKHIMDLITEDVRARQSAFSLSREEYITTIPLNEGDDIEPETGKVKRALFAVLAAGLIVIAACALALDSFKRRRNPGLTVPTHAQQRAISLATSGSTVGSAPVDSVRGGGPKGISVTYLPPQAPKPGIEIVNDAPTTMIPVVVDDATIMPIGQQPGPRPPSAGRKGKPAK